jgi:hypothetical protein
MSDDQLSDDLKVSCVIVGIEKYRECMRCTDGDCKTCDKKNGEIDPVMANWLRPRMPFNL